MDASFIRIKDDINVSPLVAELDRNIHLWSEITERQNYEGSAHKETQSIFLRWCKGQSLEEAFTEIEAIDYPALKSLPSARILIGEFLRVTKAQQLGRCLITLLPAGSRIDAHIDEGDYADHYQRFHLCITNFPESNFYCQKDETYGEFTNMHGGELWWFNHKQKHWVHNDSGYPRVTLIIDAVVPEYRSLLNGSYSEH